MNRDTAEAVAYRLGAEKLAELLSEVVQDWGHCCDNPDTCACSMGRATRLVRKMHQ